MRTFKILLSTALVAFGMNVFAQGNVIVEENFQSFKEQGWLDASVPCAQKKRDSKANFKVSKTYGDVKVDYTIVKSSVTPTCDAKKTPAEEGVTAGYVEVNKKEGELIISKLPYISTIEVGASATGDERGYALMKSVNGGPWLKIGEYIGAKAAGFDAQYGFVDTIEINESNVSLKFVPTICGKDDPTLQTFRIHNIKISGK